MIPSSDSPTTLRTIAGMRLTDRDIERFKLKLGEAERRITVMGCWLWPDKPTKSGYGNFCTGENLCYRAHRLSYALLVSADWDTSLLIRHSCDVRNCVRPDHLLTGTTADNGRDARERKRMRRLNGATNGRSVLVAEQVTRIVHDIRNGRTDGDLAAAFGVKKHVIATIRRGESWRELLTGLGYPVKPTQSRRVSPSAPKDTPFSPEHLATFASLVVTAGECNEWTGPLNSSGYGIFSWANRRDPAHCASFRIVTGRWPKARFDIAHRCHNRKCVRFEHLMELTRKEHAVYDAAAGRFTAGHVGKRCHVILTDDQIRTIKERFGDGRKTTAVQLARELAAAGTTVTTECIANVCRGKTGTHVQVPGFTPVERLAASGARGESNRNSTIKSAEQVIEIRRRRAAGDTAIALAAEFGVSRRQIDDIVSGRSWAHIKEGIAAPSRRAILKQVGPEIGRLATSGVAQEDIAARLALPTSTVARYLIRHLTPALPAEDTTGVQKPT